MASCSCWTGCEGRVWGVFDREPSIGVGVVAGGAARRGLIRSSDLLLRGQACPRQILPWRRSAEMCVGGDRVCRMEQGAVASAPEGLPRPKLGEEAGPRYGQLPWQGG